jgi:hypothetical protein
MVTYQTRGREVKNIRQEDGNMTAVSMHTVPVSEQRDGEDKHLIQAETTSSTSQLILSMMTSVMVYKMWTLLLLYQPHSLHLTAILLMTEDPVTLGHNSGLSRVGATA